MRRNPEVEAAIDEAARHGAVVTRIRHCAAHLRIYFDGPAGPRSISVCSTGSDANAPLIVRQKVRRALGVAFGRKTVGIRRRARQRAVERIEFPAPIAAVRPDGREALLSHPLAGAALSYAADRAFGALLGDILRAAGHRPRCALLQLGN
jgi:hypothetical protein